MLLTKLPVFADEAIYIRWAQLIMDEPARYAFFALNDGKTPLFIWLLVPFQYLFTDPLLAGRLVSLLVGFLQILAMGYLAKILGGQKKAVFFSMLFTAILPYWYLHHRLALMDGLMTLFLTLALIAVIKEKIFLLSLFLGLSLWTKLPAILFVSILFLWKPKLKTGVGIFGGLLIFLGLKLNPAFGQLFARGGDFLYPISEVVFHGLWRQTIINFPNYFKYFLIYLTWPIILFNIASLFSQKNHKNLHLLFWSAILFILPIGILGKMVYPRYLLPAAIFLTVNAGLYLENLVNLANKSLAKQTLRVVILVLLLANIISLSGIFIFYSYFDVGSLPLVAADKVQYLYEWSSGHGIKESSDYILELAKKEKVAVGTEGYFGTLPDGVLMYLHRRDVTNLYVEGIGYPIKNIDPKFVAKAKNFDRQL